MTPQEKLIEISKALLEKENMLKEHYKRLLMKIISEENELKKEMYKNELEEIKNIIRKTAEAKLIIQGMAELNVIYKDELLNAKDKLRYVSPELAIMLLELL